MSNNIPYTLLQLANGNENKDIYMVLHYKIIKKRKPFPANRGIEH
jgi:hypothetical protein